MIPDPFARTVMLPIRVNAGVVEFFYGGALPALKDGTIADLVVPASALEDQRLLGPLSNRLDVPILPKGTRLIAGIRDCSKLPALPEKYRLDGLPLGFSGHAEIVLQDALVLRFRGTKRAILSSCKCLLPAFTRAEGTAGPDTADSINHAYSMLSTKYEITRRSHTGNVFHTVFYRAADKRGRRVWEPLDLLRQRHEAIIARRFKDLVKAGNEQVHSRETHG
jgi:hypothetical protein